jgi:exopolysaccharide production protein ExoY
VATDMSSMHVRLLLSEGEEGFAKVELPDLRYGLHADEPWKSGRYRFAKRVVDIVGASAMFLAGAVPGLLIATAIYLTSEGPVFYREDRIGRGGRLFRIWKFRSMRQGAQRNTEEPSQDACDHEHWRVQKGNSDVVDPRITPIGAFLRRWSLDELPQVINVLRGEMSLVGPRPIIEAETILYGDLLPYYKEAIPGLSGLWQVSGRSNLDYDKRAKLDALYIQKWTLSMDFLVLTKTIGAVLTRAGAR